MIDFGHSGRWMMFVVEYLHGDSMPRVIEQATHVPDRCQIRWLCVVVVIDRLANDVDRLRANWYRQIDSPTTPIRHCMCECSAVTKYFFNNQLNELRG